MELWILKMKQNEKQNGSRHSFFKEKVSCQNKLSYSTLSQCSEI